MVLASNNCGCYDNRTSPRIGIAPKRDPEKEAGQTSTKEEQAHEIELFELFKTAFSFWMESNKVRWPVKDCDEHKSKRINDDAEVECPAPG